MPLLQLMENKSFQFKFKFHVNSAVSKNDDGALMLASDVLTAGFYCYLQSTLNLWTSGDTSKTTGGIVRDSTA